VFVYRVTNLRNGKVYIGKCAGKTVQKRWTVHKYNAQTGETGYFYNAIRKYGTTAFTVEVLYTAKTSEELSKMETFFIVLHQSHLRENGYNLTMGGEGATGFTEETRKKISQAQSGKSHTPEHNQHISQGRMGIVFSPEHLANLKKARQDQSFSSARKQAHSAGAKRYWSDPGHRQAHSIRMQLQKDSAKREREATNASSV